MGANSSVAIVVPIHGDSLQQWPLPSTVFNVMMQNPGFKVLDGKKYFKKKKAVPMYFGDELKKKRVYFLLPVSEDGSFKEDPDLYARLKNIKKTMGRGGENLIAPVFTVSPPN